METAPLKAFATSARTELIREVTARITAVLGQGSPERVESPTTVASLEKAVAAGGGGDKGRAHVADKVAYTWFNRIIALRFMDANGYTGIGVVSPAADQVGQPEVLAAAKRGQIDKEVVSNDRTMAAIAGLLNGTRQPRPGIDAQAEAYSLLLAAYCQFWHKAMPFMFERQGDFTELLIPANLLAGDSVLTRSVDVLSEDACRDVEVIGWLYQFYISERKDEVFAGFKKNKKASADEIPAATQLFTPHWIVRYLVENSVGRLWMLNRPDSSLVEQMDYFIAPVGEELEFRKISRPEELTVIDPACGSGHMLTYAFDLLYAIYEEEGYAPSEIPGLILTNNLYGTEIDARAGSLAGFALTMKAVARRKAFLKNPVKPNVCVIEPISFDPHELEFLATSDGDSDREKSFWNQFAEADNFGSLIQPDHDLVLRLTRFVETLDDRGDLLKAACLERACQALVQAKYLSERYHVAIANPPYLGSKKLSNKVSEWLKTFYPRSCSDMYAAFIDRATDFARAGGAIAMITMHSWMFLSTSRQLRSHLLTTTSTDILVHLGTKAFDTMGGEIVSTVAFVSTMRPNPTRSGLYIRLNVYDTAAEKRNSLLLISRNGIDENCYVRSSAMFIPLPGSRLMYWLSQDARDNLARSSALETAAPAIQGMITGSNDRFLRLWHEVAFGAIETAGNRGWGAEKRWAPYNKGGDSRRWYGSQSHIVDWSNGGRDFVRSRSTNSHFYFREYLSWSYRSSDEFAPRYYPPGFLWDVAGSGVFPSSHRTLVALLALLGSTTGSYLMNCLNPTSTFQVENVLEMPIIAGLEDEIYSTGLDKEVLQAIDISRRDWDQYETSWNFRVSPLMCREGSLSSRLDDLYVSHRQSVDDLTRSEAALDAYFATRYSVKEALPSAASPPRRATLAANYFDTSDPSNVGRIDEFRSDTIEALVSFAAGCMFGRYSLDEPGLILANQDSTLQDYLARVPSPTVKPDADNVIPIVDGDWFEDDIVGRFRYFLRVAFGEQHFDENLSLITQSLGVKNVREYFITKTGKSKFYDDHVQRYKKRPIYWLFSSPKGSFNALIYVHRYRPSTASTVLTYLREYVTKLESSLQQAERAGDAKEADRLRKILVELNEYEHDTLYPKASENVVIDLDDGVKVNYPKLGGALRRIAGLESSGD